MNHDTAPLSPREPQSSGRDALNSPDLGRILASIDARLARLEAASHKVDEVVAQAPNFVAALADTFDSHVARLAADGIDVDRRGREVLRLLERLTAPETMRALESLLPYTEAVAQLASAGLLEPAARSVLEQASSSFANSAATRHEKVGAFGALRSLGDPDVQRALGFALDVARGLGRGLSAPPALPGPTTTTVKQS